MVKEKNIHSKIEGIIFDFDGVIVDSEPLWEIADRTLVEAEGFTYIPETKYSIMGLSPLESIVKLCQIYKLITSPDKLNQNRESLMKKFYENTIEMNPGAFEILEYLFENGIKLALASSTPKRLFDRTLVRFGIDKFFDVIITSEDVKKSKPDPEIFISAQKRLGIDKDHLLIVEDSVAGVKAAISSGIKTVWLKNENAILHDLKPDYVIKSLSEIRLILLKY